MKVMQFFSLSKINAVCVSCELFTKGSNEEFDYLSKWSNEPYSDTALFELASYIFERSNNLMGLEDVAGELLRNGIVRYIEK